MTATTFHNWLGIVTLGLHLVIVARLVYLEEEHLWFGTTDGVLIILAETSLALLVIDGFYLSVALQLPTRIMHHLGAFAPVGTSMFFVLLMNHSAIIHKGRRLVRYTLFLFALNSVLIFLAYWVSSGASMGWWLLPERWSNEVR